MRLSPDFTAELRKTFLGDIRLDLASRVLYSTDASIYQIEPLGVAFPRSQEDLQAAVELAAKYRVPLLARGSGSSLAGQAVGEALVLDCSRWLDHILAINPEERTALVEPGVILGDLNRQARRFGLQFGPDPASAERATLGGVIANNGTGAHSIVYGMTADHLVSADVVLSDGSLATLGDVGVRQANADATGAHGAGRQAELLQAIHGIREHHADAIRKNYPRTWRNSAGYRLNYLLPWSGSSPPEWSADVYPPNHGSDRLNLAPLLAGSEGTLAIIRRAKVSLVSRPPHAVLAVLPYDSLAEACDAVPAILDLHPSAIELIPGMILRLARGIPEYAHAAEWISVSSEALLLIEFSGDDPAALHDSASALGGVATIADSPAAQANVWGLRKVGLGILDSRAQRERPVAFIEDCVVPVEQLGAFVRELQHLMAAHGVEGGIYGHASAGCLHIRPILDLQSRAGVAALRAIAQETLDLTLRLGGSMVSEHGDGIARSEWLQRTYGEELMGAMRLLKRAADPQGILNPGKLINAPAMDSHLRHGWPYDVSPWNPDLDFSGNGGLPMAIEQCNGQGVCRKDTGAMCPSFQASREEMYSTRGRANLLRALMMTGAPGAGARQAGRPQAPKSAERLEIRGELADAVFGALDLCLACKACKAECPSGVDMAKLKAAFLAEYYRHHARPLRDFLFGYFHVSARILAMFSTFIRAAARVPLVWSAVARLARLAHQRPLPVMAARRAGVPRRIGRKAVLFVRDPFNHYIDSRVERAAFDLLNHAGYDIFAPDVIGAGASLYSKGFLGGARKHVSRLLEEVRKLDPRAALPVVAIEPSEISALAHDCRDLLPGASRRQLEQLEAVSSVEEFLLGSDAAPAWRYAPRGVRVLFHPHCHEKAEKRSMGADFVPRYAGAELLRACGYKVEIIDAGCCGMAGTFGYEAEHYEMSQAVGQRRLFPAIAAMPDAEVAATGASCRLQIAQGTTARPKHPLELAARVILA